MIGRIVLALIGACGIFYAACVALACVMKGDVGGVLASALMAFCSLWCISEAIYR